MALGEGENLLVREVSVRLLFYRITRLGQGQTNTPHPCGQQTETQGEEESLSLANIHAPNPHTTGAERATKSAEIRRNNGEGTA